MNNNIDGDEWCEFSAEITELHECNNYPFPLTYFDNLKCSQNSFADYHVVSQTIEGRIVHINFLLKLKRGITYSFKNETIQEENKINNLVKLHLGSCYLSSQKGNFIIFFWNWQWLRLGLTDTYPLINRLYNVKKIIKDLKETFDALTNLWWFVDSFLFNLNSSLFYS